DSRPPQAVDPSVSPQRSQHPSVPNHPIDQIRLLAHPFPSISHHFLGPFFAQSFDGKIPIPPERGSLPEKGPTARASGFSPPRPPFFRKGHPSTGSPRRRAEDPTRSPVPAGCC